MSRLRVVIQPARHVDKGSGWHWTLQESFSYSWARVINVWDGVCISRSAAERAGVQAMKDYHEMQIGPDYDNWITHGPLVIEDWKVGIER